jgi:gamma-glutamyltranspeptidase/glutathione hydrolase
MDSMSLIHTKSYLTFLLQCFITFSILTGSVYSSGEIRDPEPETGIHRKKTSVSNDFMVAAANPYAVNTGYKILKQGGSAVDAAIAVQMVLGLVEPQSSGIGGGAFMLFWNNQSKNLSSYDGRETAPMAVTENYFINKIDKKPMDWWKALVGGRSVGVPGVLKMLELAHHEHGKLPWNTLFDDAIKLAESGFVVSDRLHQLIKKRFNPGLDRYEASRKYFFPGGKPLQPGIVVKNRLLADAYKLIAKHGTDVFYKGEIAKDIIKAVKDTEENPGVLSATDLINYKAKKRDPVCAPYRLYMICSMGPPSSGGLTVIQILSLLSHFDLSKYHPLSKESVHLFTQAARLAFADREMYMADTDYVKTPITELIDQSYLEKRAKQIKYDNDMGKAAAGAFYVEKSYAPGNSPEYPSTSHISIIDKYGNAISMTTSIEMAFGSTVMTNGFLLNNTLTDFSFKPERNGIPVANRVQPGKRPRSSMSPTMVFNKDNKLVLIIGSPGGSRIINYVAKTIIAVLDWGLDIQDAIDLPNFSNRNGATDLEKNTPITKIAEELELMEHTINIRPLNSGLHGILIRDNKLRGGADSRREGTIMGD